MPLRPSTSADQKACRPTPKGLSTPIPVITISRGVVMPDHPYKDAAPREQLGALGRLGDEPRTGFHDFGGQTQTTQQADGQIRYIQFPPEMTMGRTALIGMVVVVPTFAIAPQPDQPVVAAILVGFVIAITPHVRYRVDTPGDVPH